MDLVQRRNLMCRCCFPSILMASYMSPIMPTTSCDRWTQQVSLSCPRVLSTMIVAYRCCFPGYCPAGQYASSSNSVGCLDSPAGFYKPRVSFSDNYYICPAGKYSHAASSACSYCPYALAAGTTVCLYPTSQPSSQPSKQPSQPTGQPTSSPSQPSGQPTGAPSQPSGQPTQSPTVICLAGTYETLGSCHLAPAGELVSFTSVLAFQTCSRYICRF